MDGRSVMRTLLSNGYAGKDMSELADNLLFTFPSVNAVLEADYASLMTVKGMTRAVAIYILTLRDIKNKIQAPLVRIRDSKELIEHAQRVLSEKDCEYAELYLVDKDGKVLNYYSFTSGLKRRVNMDAQDFISKISLQEAYGFYVLHNHTGSSPRPSEFDDLFTARLLSVCPVSGKKFLDHCIVAGKKWFSYRESGKFKELGERTSRKFEQ